MADIEEIRKRWNPHVYHTFDARQITEDFQELFSALDNWMAVALGLQEELEKAQAEIKAIKKRRFWRIADERPEDAW